MATTRCVPRCSGTSQPELYLPVDLLLEIVARSDVTTVVRCTTASRILRRAILGPAFRRRLVAAGGSFDPALLLGVSYRTTPLLGGLTRHTHHVIHTPYSTQPRVCLDTSSLPDWFEAVASRDGLHLIRVHLYHLHLRVYNTFTGHATHLPRISLPNPYSHVFLSVGDAGASYEVFLADKSMWFQTFSSAHGQWGDARQISIAEHETNPYCLGTPCPAVIGRTVYWPCKRYDNWVSWDRILAMDVDTATGTIMELPPGIIIAREKDRHHLLTSVCGFLSLLIMESVGISMWTMTPVSSPQSKAIWSRQLMIDMVEIEKVLGKVNYTLMPFVLEGFGERSGALIVRVINGDLLQIDLGNKVVKRIHSQKDGLVSRVFLHEIDLISLLQAMKHS